MASERRFVAENVRRVLLKEYLMKEVSRAGFGGLDIQRTPMGTRVVLTTERPGLVIGRKGQTIKNLTTAIEDRFGFENPQIEVDEVKDPNLNAQIMAEKLAFSLERGWHFRRAGHSSVRRIMDSGARGCHIILAGKLTGQRHRTEKFKEGSIKFCGETKNNFMQRGYAVAKLKMGVIGVTVEIMSKDSKLPTDIEIYGKTEVAEKYPELFAAKEAPAASSRSRGRGRSRGGTVMATKAAEIREMSADERNQKLKKLRDELMHERGVAAMGGAPASPGAIRALRKEIARILTIQKEEEDL